MQNPVAGSAAVAQGMVYIGSLDGFLYALDAATGKRIWQFKTQEQPLSPHSLPARSLSALRRVSCMPCMPGQAIPSAFPHPRPSATPRCGQRTGLFPSGSQIYAVAADAREIPGNTSSNWSGRSSGSGNSRCLDRLPSLGAGGVFLPGNLPMGFSSPAVAPEAFYVGDTEGYLYARDALTGEGLWQFQAGSA